MAPFYIGGNMVETHCCFIKEEYYKLNPNFINMLDPGDYMKQSKRTHLCIAIQLNGNNVYIPLRNNLGSPVRKYGKIGFSIPSAKRPNAGLDYRYSLIINNSQYIESHKEDKLPQSQYSAISKNFETIKQEISVYLNRYIKVANKNRQQKEPLFRNSSLVNFHEELGIKECLTIALSEVAITKEKEVNKNKEE